ncbi:MAG: hypothetical protein WCA15_21450 [Candidatus Acidiferrales bacterium]
MNGFLDKALSVASCPLFLIFLFCAFIAQASVSQPQHGTAESGYYPPSYGGDTFSGAVTKVDDTSREVTLSYSDTAHKKTAAFVGVIAANYIARWKDGTEHPLKPSDLPVGTKLKVYYMTKEVKTDGKKTKINTIFQIKESPNLAKQYSTFQPH